MDLSKAVIASFIVATAMPVSAQPVGVQAEVQYNNGRDLMAAGKIVEACAAFERSQKLEPAVTTLIALATCHERLGQLATALELVFEAELQTRSANDTVTAQLHKIALDRAIKLEPRVPKLTIHVPDTSKIDGLEIRLDQGSVPAERWNRTLPIDGGTYTITARAPGANEWSTRVTFVLKADTKTIDIPNLREFRQALEVSSKPLPTADASVRHDSFVVSTTRRRWPAWRPWVAVGAGGAITAVSGILHGVARENFQAYDSNFLKLACWASPESRFPGCTSGEIGPQLNARLALARKQQTIALGGYVTGGSLLAAGVVLLYLNRPHSVEQGAARSFALDVTVTPMASTELFGILASAIY